MTFEGTLGHGNVPSAHEKQIRFSKVPFCPHRTDGASCPGKTRSLRRSLRLRPGARRSGATATSGGLRPRRGETTGRTAGQRRRSTARTRSWTAARQSQSTRTRLHADRHQSRPALFSKVTPSRCCLLCFEAVNDAERTASPSRPRQRRAKAKAGRTTRRGRGRGESDVPSGRRPSVTSQPRCQELQRWQVHVRQCDSPHVAAVRQGLFITLHNQQQEMKEAS